MQHRRLRFSKQAKALTATVVALAAAVGVTVAQAGESGKQCAAFDTLTLGKYYVDNNLWGQTRAPEPSASGTTPRTALPSPGHRLLLGQQRQGH